MHLRTERVFACFAREHESMTKNIGKIPGDFRRGKLGAHRNLTWKVMSFSFESNASSRGRAQRAACVSSPTAPRMPSGLVSSIMGSSILISSSSWKSINTDRSCQLPILASARCVIISTQPLSRTRSEKSEMNARRSAQGKSLAVCQRSTSPSAKQDGFSPRGAAPSRATKSLQKPCSLAPGIWCQYSLDYWRDLQSANKLMLREDFGCTREL